MHFYTNTTIDTLDYSGEGLNSGSKVVIAAYGNPIRTLSNQVHHRFEKLQHFSNCKLIIPGVVALKGNPFTNYTQAILEINELDQQLRGIENEWKEQNGLPEEIVMIVVCDDSDFITATFNNFLWATFTKIGRAHV